jgi:hypothetical protein
MINALGLISRQVRILEISDIIDGKYGPYRKLKGRDMALTPSCPDADVEINCGLERFEALQLGLGDLVAVVGKQGIRAVLIRDCDTLAPLGKARMVAREVLR